MNPKTTAPVLVTGASGFIAIHCIIQLLEKGYHVRGTLRSLARESELRATLAKFVDVGERLALVQADLLDDSGWEAAVRGCEYVLHVASPFPLAEPEHEDDLIRPAREGTLRVLKAAAQARVRRVVQTSSIAAIGYGHGRGKIHFDENDWSQADGEIGAYPKSKTLAERAAWDFIRSLEGDKPMELVAINPGLVLGPLPNKNARSSGVLVTELLSGKQPGVAHMHFEAVDVRDVAAAHIAAMTNPDAAGQRFICVGAEFWMREAAVTLKKNFSGRGYKTSTLEFPNVLIHILALFDPAVRLVSKSLDNEAHFNSQRMRDVLGIQPRGLEEMLVAMGESLIEMKLI